MVDTAGRLAIDSEMMAEIQAIHVAIKPIENLFVVDAMLGQSGEHGKSVWMKPCLWRVWC